MIYSFKVVEPLFRYGRDQRLTVNSHGRPALLTTYINTNYVAARASNLSMQKYMNYQHIRETLSLALNAYAFTNADIPVLEISEDQVQFGFVLSPSLKLTSFLVTASLTNKLYDIILDHNVDAFINWGTVCPNLEHPVFFSTTTAKNEENIVLTIMNEAYRDSDFNEAIVELVKQVTVPLRWASYVPIGFHTNDIKCYYKLLEIMLAFQIFPQRCKEAGAGLAMELYKIFEVIWPNEFIEFIKRYGIANLIPNDQAPISDYDYWNNSRIPSIFLRIQRDDLVLNNNIDQILRLIRPVCERIEYVQAQRANFPRVRPVTYSYCPYDLAHDTGIDLTPFKIRLINVIEFMRGQMINFTKKTSATKATKNTHVNFLNNLKGALADHGLGFDRNVRVPLYHLINRQMMVMGYYDGQLGTRFPPHLCTISQS